MSILIWLVKNEDEDAFYHRFLPVGIAMLLAIYVYMALALVAIAKKTDTAHALWGWIPIMNVVLMLKIARKPVSWIILLLIPRVNIVFAALVWMRIAKTRQLRLLPPESRRDAKSMLRFPFPVESSTPSWKFAPWSVCVRGTHISSR